MAVNLGLSFHSLLFLANIISHVIIFVYFFGKKLIMTSEENKDLLKFVSLLKVTLERKKMENLVSLSFIIGTSIK